MISNNELLKCNIKPAGSLFTVKKDPKSTILYPHSKGFISYVMGPDYENPNIVFQHTILTRLGKTGKPRIASTVMLCPIFNIKGVTTRTMFPHKYKTLKNFVNITTNSRNTTNDNNMKFRSNELWAQLLSKISLLKELSTTTYPIKHRLSALTFNGTNNGIVDRWIINNGKSVLNNFFLNIEAYYNNNDMDILNAEFGLLPQELNLHNELNKSLVKNILPKYEYDLKVLNVIANALKWVEIFVTNNKIENKHKVKKAIVKTKRDIENNIVYINDCAKHRINTILNYRKVI